MKAMNPYQPQSFCDDIQYHASKIAYNNDGVFSIFYSDHDQFLIIFINCVTYLKLGLLDYEHHIQDLVCN